MRLSVVQCEGCPSSVESGNESEWSRFLHRFESALQSVTDAVIPLKAMDLCPACAERMRSAMESATRPAPKALPVEVAKVVGPIKSLDQVEQEHILGTLDRLRWNKSQTAITLGIERSTLDRKLKKYEVQRPRLILEQTIPPVSHQVSHDHNLATAQ